MTRHWQTRDPVTNANLEYVESLAQLRPGLTVEQFMGKLRAVIGIRRMLPAAVLRHFDLPYLFIGDDAYDWDADWLGEEATRLCAALDTGLAAAHADPGLARGGATDLSDRPPTRGEEIAAALPIATTPAAPGSAICATPAHPRDRTASSIVSTMACAQAPVVARPADRLRNGLGARGHSPGRRRFSS